MKNVVLLGSTGSIGTSTVKVAEDLPDQIRLHRPRRREQFGRCCWSKRAGTSPPRFRLAIRPRQTNCEMRWARRREVFCGEEGLLKLATLPAADIVLIAIVGTAGLQAGARRDSRGQGHCRRVEGNSGHGRRNRHERGAQIWRARAGRGQRAFRDFPMPRRQTDDRPSASCG